MTDSSTPPPDDPPSPSAPPPNDALQHPKTPRRISHVDFERAITRITSQCTSPDVLTILMYFNEMRQLLRGYRMTVKELAGPDVLRQLDEVAVVVCERIFEVEANAAAVRNAASPAESAPPRPRKDDGSH